MKSSNYLQAKESAESFEKTMEEFMEAFDSFIPVAAYYLALMNNLSKKNENNNS